MTKNKILIIAIIIILGGFFYFRYSEAERHKFKIVFLNVGQGDATVIQFETGEKMLVDCGPDRGILSALGRNLAFYDRTIDYLLISHPDLDHYGGCVDVLKNYQIKKIYINGREKTDSYFREWKSVSTGYLTEIAGVSTTLTIASSSFRFFSPDLSLVFKNKISDNDYSIIFKLSHGSSSYLFTGDAEETLEKLLVEKYCPEVNNACPLQSGVLKVGHHGSDGSSSELFLSRVKPIEAVISVGKNKFGHPGLRAIRHLERIGAKIKRTDESGDISIK
ncbi:MAG: MBL fold metallo-hydrolase [Patescibacteria group bacterium]